MRGGKVKQIIAELLGRRDGVSFGKGNISLRFGELTAGEVLQLRWEGNP